MRIFIFLGVFYAIMVAFGISSSHAQRGGACSDANCTEQQSATEAALSDTELASTLESLLASIQDKVSLEKLHAIIKKAAMENEQVAGLLKLVQQYGVLTEIKLDEPNSEPAPEGE
jgi:hypothetical protein